MFVFYDWPFPHVYFAKNVANIIFPLILGSVMPSVFWRCWFGSRKGIRLVKNWVVGCWHGYLSGARCRLAYGPADATATHCLLSCFSKIQTVLPFWYRLTRVVPDKGLLNGSVCVLGSVFSVCVVFYRVFVCTANEATCAQKPNISLPLIVNISKHTYTYLVSLSSQTLLIRYQEG